MSTSWHEPDVSTIHLVNGQTVEAEINGLDWEETHGYAFAQGRDIEVQRINGSDEWEEVCG
jgi:hypothetical protein